MIQSLKSTAFSVFGASALTLGFTAMPSFALSTTLGIPSQSLSSNVGWGGVNVISPVTGNSGENFNTNEFYNTIPIFPFNNFSNPNFVSVPSLNFAATSGTFNVTQLLLDSLTAFTVEFDYSLVGTGTPADGSFGFINDPTGTPTITTVAALLATPGGVIAQNATFNLLPFLIGAGVGTKSFRLASSADGTLRFSNFNFTTDTTPVPFEFNPALGLVLTGALFGGSKLLKKAKKSTKVG